VGSAKAVGWLVVSLLAFWDGGKVDMLRYVPVTLYIYLCIADRAAPAPTPHLPGPLAYRTTEYLDMFKTALLPLIIALIGGSRQAQACGRHPRWDRRGESKLSSRQATDESSAEHR
jgi:hypothetical protein